VQQNSESDILMVRQLMAVKTFVDKVGSIEAAKRLLDMLAKMTGDQCKGRRG